MGLKKTFFAEEILDWRRNQLNIGGRLEDLDWLLDIGGGLEWASLQKIKIFQDKDKLYELSLSLEDLSFIWSRHLKENIPLQHLIGRCPWRDFELEVTPFALIPRQETELLIDLALEKVDNSFCGRWADMGTGSGALAIALARSLPDWFGHAIDCSQDALLLAEKNLNRLAVNSKVDFNLGSWWEPIKDYWGTFDLVVANPPYIPSELMKGLHPVVRDHEPHLALCGGQDGMESFREISIGAMKALAPNGWLLFEHHHDQSERALNYLINLGFRQVSFENDLAGIKRFAIARRP
tara:strand:- start:187 stop:1068 length:882 start_codon:yes stop_codon:yes gene_type:complete